MNKAQQLYIAVNELMAKLGCDGEVNAHQKEATDVMNALWGIDRGCPDYNINPDVLNEPA